MERATAVVVPLPMIRQLVSCSKSTRDKAIRSLKLWLPNQPEISADEMKMIWKGLFYCVWHADKSPVQAELIDRLTSLLLTLDLSLSIQYFSVFLLTMRREWSGIDGLRLDKFYLLIRKMIFNFFRLLKRNSWDLELTNRLVSVLDQRTFSADDKYQGGGVNYHVVTVFLEEIKQFLPLKIEVLDPFFKLFISVMGKTPNKVLLGKIKSNIFDVLLKMGFNLLETMKSGTDIDSNDEVMLYGTIASVMGFSNNFFELGSSSDCLQGNRKVLFGLHESFLKLEKDLSSSGIKLSIPEIKNDDEEDDEIPNLIPISVPSDSTALVIESKEHDESVIGSSKKKKKKAEKCSGEGCCKKKKKSDKKKNSSSKTKEKSNISLPKEIPDSNEAQDKNENPLLDFNESIISNLQMQFEKIATESGMDNNNDSNGISFESPKKSGDMNNGVSKKRKRVKSVEGKEKVKGKIDAVTDNTIEKSVGEKSAKKVKFSMKNNLVWKPQTPLPPQSLRIPPSVTPRGSALKQGIPAGPIKEMKTVAGPRIVRRFTKKGKKVIKHMKKT